MDGNDMAGAIDKVKELTEAAMRVELTPATGEPAGHYYLMTPDGKAALTLAKPAWHAEKLATPADLRDFIAHLGGTAGDDLLYYDDRQVVYVYEQSDRRKFSSAADGAGSIQHSRESIGRSINAAVTGEAALPEDVWLTVPVFENHPFRARIACALEIMPQDQTFQLLPFPLEVQQAMDTALADVVNTLKGENVPPAFRGSPF
jgi:hypothetical protein